MCFSGGTLCNWHLWIHRFRQQETADEGGRQGFFSNFGGKIVTKSHFFRKLLIMKRLCDALRAVIGYGLSVVGEEKEKRV
jgi:hypothetical protein